jgi:hypothetical protein
MAWTDFSASRTKFQPGLSVLFTVADPGNDHFIVASWAGRALMRHARAHPPPLFRTPGLLARLGTIARQQAKAWSGTEPLPWWQPPRETNAG